MTSPPDLRQRLADFHLGAPVYTSDDVHVGSLHRVVVDQQTWEPHTIVVKETRRFSGHLLAPGAGLITDDLVIPLSMVVEVAHDRVALSATSREVRRCHPYLTYSYGPVSSRDLSVELVTAGLAASPPMPTLTETAEKPSTDIEVRQGEKVMLGHQGRKLGEVRDVLIDDGELVGIVVRPEGFFQHDVIVQLRFLERSDDAALFVRMTPEDLDHLQPFQPKD